MATKNNLPNIPIYIGDWEKDCNVLSLASEAAWLHIVFKMWNNGKQSTYKIPTKGLQNLWRCSIEKVEEIIEELGDFNICGITIDGRFVEFTCRRYEKENKLSKTRSNAVSSRYNNTNSLQTSNKSEQNTDIDYENESENENETKTNYSLKSEKFKKSWDEWKSYRLLEFKSKYVSTISEDTAITKLNNLAKTDDKAIAIIQQSIANGWKGFFEIKQTLKTATDKKTKNKSNRNRPA
jgi:uncharacterized protein YdaU (DUF1376 family)